MMRHDIQEAEIFMAKTGFPFNVRTFRTSVKKPREKQLDTIVKSTHKKRVVLPRKAHEKVNITRMIQKAIIDADHEEQVRKEKEKAQKSNVLEIKLGKKK